MEVLKPASSRWIEFMGLLSQAVLRSNCTHDDEYRHAKRVMAEMGGIDIEQSLALFRKHGGYCDVEILLNVISDEQREEEEKLFEVYRKEREGEPLTDDDKRMLGITEQEANNG
jgi:hypothetical protein